MAAFYPIVDVLRALSVVAVVAYHAGVPGIPGGYVGVDVFFVISGFLIIGQIVSEHQRGNFSYAGFWARRALRILPTYLLVIVASSLIALCVLVMPDEFREFGRQVAWSAGMAVNHLFLNEQGYFDTAAGSKPLLHLWSLAVEEQFYVLAPLVLGLLSWLAAPRFGANGRRVVAAIVTLMFVSSLWACVRYTGSDDDKNYAFYLMPLRAWEFILGGAVPFLVPWIRQCSSTVLTWIMAVGFGLILGAIFGFDHGAAFPSWRAALPAVGATMVIASGLAAPDTAMVRAMSVRWVMWIGLISYAWYLWHWPLMAFSRIYNFGELPLAWGIAMAVFSMLLAALTYYAIEKPVKEWRKRSGLRLELKPIAVGVAACVVVIAMGQAMAVKLPERASASIPEALLPGAAKNAGVCRLHVIKSASACLKKLAKENRSKVGVVAGDSHARASYASLSRLAAKRGTSLVSLTEPGCVPLVGVHLVRTSTNKVYDCHTAKERGFEYLFTGKIEVDYAIIYARWNNATPWLNNDRSTGDQYRFLREAESGQSEPQDRIFEDSFRETIQKLQKGGVKRVLVISATPEFDGDVSSCVIRARKYRQSVDDRCARDEATVLNRRIFSSMWLRNSVQGMSNVRLVDPLPAFCDGRYCRGYDDKEVLYRDDNHVNNRGMQRIIDRYEEDFTWVIGR